MWQLVNFNDHNAFRLNVSSTLVLPKQRDKSTKFNVPVCHYIKVKAAISAIKESELAIQTFLKILKPWLVTFSSEEGTFTGNLQVILFILIVIVY